MPCRSRLSVSLHCTMVEMGLLFLVAVWAGVQNALAGGGTFLTLPALMATGMSALAANITSTVALFPGQVASCWGPRRHVAGVGSLSIRMLMLISLAGALTGAVLLLVTSSSSFAKLVPWLVLFATSVFAWGSFGPKLKGLHGIGPRGAGVAQFLISLYGGYFTGGIGFLMLAALSAAGQGIRAASANKNVLSGVVNASAVFVFLFSPEVHWLEAGVVAVGAITGGLIGGAMIDKVNEKALRIAAVVIGLALTVGLFIRAP